jgi:hypothetical protein
VNDFGGAKLALDHIERRFDTPSGFAPRQTASPYRFCY